MSTRRLGFLAIVVLLGAVAVTLGFFGPFRPRAPILRLPGVVEIQEVRLGSKLGGRVAEVLVLEGEVASAGQLLVRFETPELEAQKVQQQARIAMMEADWRKAEKGFRQEEIDQTRSDLATALADLKFTLQDFERADRLYRAGSMARADFDAARAARDRSQGRYDTARYRLALMEAGTRPEEKDFAKAQLDESRGKLKEIEANLAEALVRAPERCFVEIVAVRKGDLVPPNTPIIRVLRADDLWVKVYVPETELGKVRVGQSVSVTNDSYPGEPVDGVVFQIANESEFTPRNVQSVDERRHQVFGIKVRVKDPRGIFKSGMAAEVTFPLDRAPNGNPPQ